MKKPIPHLVVSNDEPPPQGAIPIQIYGLNEGGGSDPSIVQVQPELQLKEIPFWTAVYSEEVQDNVKDQEFSHNFAIFPSLTIFQSSKLVVGVVTVTQLAPADSTEGVVGWDPYEIALAPSAGIEWLDGGSLRAEIVARTSDGIMVENGNRDFRLSVRGDTVYAEVDPFSISPGEALNIQYRITDVAL